MTRLALQMVVLTGLAIFCGLLIYVLMNTLSGSNSAPKRPMHQPSSFELGAQSVKISDFNPPRIADFPQTVARALFWKERKEWRPPAAPVAPSQPPKPPVAPVPPRNVKLRGVFLNGNSRKAFFEGIAGASQWLDEGERIEGWTIATIGPDSVQLRHGSHTVVLDLHLSARP